ncbi:tetratricopeptide repeat protein [Microbulbifer sp. TRSA002]|uniref:tetratricopeptide repeat protein n=1 Tax=Microbulbifer sp. TRSA002 TaxID=3243382 RepID=UPI004039482E
MRQEIHSHLDTAELLHCALEASRTKDHDKAIELLKRCLLLEKQPATHLLLAAEYAQIKFFDRAIEEMQMSIEMAPTLWVAHFQLSQVYLVTQQIEKAKNIWQHLVITPNTPKYFQLFSNGLLAIIEEQTQSGLDLLRQGIQSNTENPALNSDIEQIIQVVTETAKEEKSVAENSDAINKMLLSQYGAGQPI